jgi:hypothetical protein
MWCLVVCDLENLKDEEAMTCVGSQRHRGKKNHMYIVLESFEMLRWRRMEKISWTDHVRNEDVLLRVM